MAWWKYAKPGDKVVCVDDDWDGTSSTGAPPPKSGSVYTIESLTEVGAIHTYLGCHLFIQIIGFSDRYNAACFRPVQKKSTEASMAALRAHLITKEVPEHA